MTGWLRRLLERINAKRKAEERERDIDRVRRDLRVMRLETEFYRHDARRWHPR